MKTSHLSKNKRPFVWPATLIVLLATLARLWQLPNLPPGLSQDEVLNADIVEGIRAGRHALFFREGFGHEPLYHYFAVPFQYLLGDNWLSIRFPAAILGLLLTALLLGWVKYRRGYQVALLAGGMMAVSWWPIIFSRIGLRPIMLPVFLIATAWAWEKKRGWLAGLWLGLAFYCYTAARVFIALPLLLLIWEGWRWWRQNPRPQLQKSDVFVTGRMGLLALLLYTPLQLTLWLDPTLQERVDQLLGPLTALQNGQLGPILTTISQTLGGFFISGDPRWTYTVAGTPIFDWLTGLLLIGGILWAIARVPRDRAARFLLLWFGLGLIPSAITPQAPSIIRLIALLPLAFYFPAEALAILLKRMIMPPKMRRNLWIGATVVLVLVNGGRALQTAQEWNRASETADKYGAIWAHIARDIKQNDPARIVVIDSWVDPIDADSLRRNLGLAEQARWVQSGSAAAGALILPAGDGLALLYEPEYAPLAPQLREFVGLQEPLRRSATVPTFAVYKLPDSWPAREEIPFGQALTLIDRHLTGAAASENNVETIELLTVWRVDQPLPADLALFVHLIADNDEILAQHDGLDGFAPLLQPGDILIQRHPIPFDAVDPHQPLRFRLGVYRRSTGERLRPAAQENPFLIFPAAGFDDHR